MIPQGFDEWHLALQAPWGRLGVGLGVAAAVAIIALGALGARREKRPARRWTVIGLRAGATVAALVLFLQPAVQLENVTRLPNRVAVLVDASESMGLAEQPGEPTRAQRAARIVASSAPAFDSWRKDHRLDFYTFGSTLTPSAQEALSLPAGAPSNADATRIREALSALRSRYQGRDLAGVVVISDGVDNGRLGEALANGELDNEARDFLRALDTPVHTVWTGKAGLRDLAIARVLADDFAFARNAVKVEAVVRAVGAGPAGWAGRRVPVTLKRDGQPVKTVDVTIDPEHPDQKIVFEFTPDRVGKYLYEISAPVLDGEAIPGNNARTFMLKVIRDKIRVLQVAGRPSWDERFLRGLLKHDPNIDLISFFILRTPTDVEAVSPDEMSLIPFPTEELFREQLRSFDVVFLQNFNFEPYGIGVYLDEIKAYVEEGGGLAMLGGDLSFSSGGYARTAVADVLPVELLDDNGLGETNVNLDPFPLQITPAGTSHPITSLRLEARENAARWAALPPLEGCNLVGRPRPGATVLGVHPYLKGPDGKPLAVLTVGEAGKGRSLALAADSSWRWGFGAAGGDDDDGERGRAYQRFWENAIRWLIRDPELRFLRVETDQPEYPRGEKVRITVRARTPDYRPARDVEIALAVARVGGGAVPGLSGTHLTLRTDENGEADTELPPLPPGGYRVTARANQGRGDAPNGSALQAAMQDDEVFLVRGGGRELEDAEARDDLLRSVADATGGSFIGPHGSLAGLSFHEPEVVRVDRHRDVELWSTWLSLLAAALLLSADWTLRRRWGMA